MRRSSKLLLQVAALGLLGLAAPLAAQKGGCGDTANAVCVEQLGDRNAATVDLKGSRNGSGTLGGEASGALSVLTGAIPGGGIAARIIVPSMASGTVSQQGDNNNADLLIRGDDNQFGISQQGDRNSATQMVLGNRNATATAQSGSDNQSGQLAIGSDNKNYISQSGGNNVATSQQVPSAELALLSSATPISSSLIGALASGAFGTANNNTVLLEQNGGNNLADLLQVGSGHNIALRQDGNASISILQMGTGKSISVEQTAGSQGIQITQH